MKTANDIYKAVTDSIVEALENSTGKYVLPWHKTGSDVFSPTNISTKKQYRGINIVALWVTAEKRGYSSGYWATFKQWQSLGATVRKGEKGAQVVYFETVEKKDQEKAADEKKDTFLVAKYYTVFNLSQVEGYEPEQVLELSENERFNNAEMFVCSLGADIRPGGDSAYYSPAEDYIQMPYFGAFRNIYGYYGTLFHELTHWTGGTRRLDRNLKGRFGTESYAAEELVAELGAAFLCAQFGIESQPRPDHAAYIKNWITLLKSDSKAILTAASKAQEAVDYMLKLHQESRAAA